MTRADLFQQIKSKASYLCVGLDPDPGKLPSSILKSEDPVFEFNKAIIDATRDLCVAYKPNLAFYEALGAQGWVSLHKTIRYIGSSHFVIADAKRGDIGNTSRLYAQAFFEKMEVDALTVAPYMGVDSVEPFLHFDGKWVVLLALTSNKGSQDFQFGIDKDSGFRLFEKVLVESTSWGSPDNLMYVVGATHPAAFRGIRQLVPEHFLLVPGVGAQGGDLEAISKFGFNHQCGLLVNSSRGILYAGQGIDFADAARQAARSVQKEMAQYLDQYLPV